jgi:uncharacterized protein YdiU (UPF0061 family)
MNIVMGAKQLKKSPIADPYSSFEKLDGQHPWMKVMPSGYVPYRVRELQTGEVPYFNFALAKEMGLIPSEHANQMNPQLKEKILSTFSIQIINEYDELTGKKFKSETIKPNKYMASRYLQLQHNSKKGTTSGDGRGIWNGVIEYRGRIWDVSSRGTGVTCLAPGAVEANRPLRTGAGEFGYGCGLAEIDELYGAAILAEIMHLQGIHTERVLCIIDLGKGYGIGVRAAQNLLRPAHLFMYLKQSKYDELKAGIDYLIDRQVQNSRWKINARSSLKYDQCLEEICESFAKFTAQLDIDYIFAWLDWDGDNVLADAGIIDYGSVRQFGTRHDQYRYDDVERFSTNLNEQRLKARGIVQVFAQITSFLNTKKKTPLKEFAKHPTVLKFNSYFSHYRANRLLYRMGFNESQRGAILKNKELFTAFDKEFSYFEKAKVSGNKKKVADGVNHPALFNLRNLLKDLPEFYFKNGIDSNMSEEFMYKTMLTVFAKSNDTKIRSKHKGHLQNFQRLYKMLILTACEKQKINTVLKDLSERASKLNREDRITGNALIQIVLELMNQIKKGLPASDVQKIIDQMIFSYQNMPEVKVSKYFESKPRLVVKPEVHAKILDVIRSYKDDI